MGVFRHRYLDNLYRYSYSTTMGSNVFLGQYHYEPNGMIAAVT